jgi:hypothetical protein
MMQRRPDVKSQDVLVDWLTIHALKASLIDDAKKA